MFLDAPNLKGVEKEYLCKAIDEGYVSSIGPFVNEFEKRFASFLAAGPCVSCQSGTSALHMALHELGVSKGDEVIVPVITFVGTVYPVSYVGAKPVFVDIDEKTWNMIPELVASKITARTKAIIPVHLYGNPCDMDKLLDIGEKHGVPVIEDASESLGAEYKGKLTGTLGEFGCFSFNGNKLITTGNGGMISGKDPNKIGHIRFLVNQAREEGAFYFHSEVGYNLRLSNIAASLGLAQLERVGEFLALKRRFNDIYRAELSGVDGISFQEQYKGARSSYWLSCISFGEGIDVTGVIDELKRSNIPTRRVFTPLIEFPPYKEEDKSCYSNAYMIFDSGICLPGSTLNTEKDIMAVCHKLKEIVG
ncbi:MAG: DegT/DnrJ/EryC1/StrS family aminotransferase [Candidatus Omnitrophica bacterium]|nr:DegT/DnrJ/EryC1/StrS family aminotransferase [Candidatus Omnitrophota bacterium]